VDTIVVSTVVYEEPEEIYDVLIDFPRYAKYSEHLTEVRRLDGNGAVGTQYALDFAWWKLTYTAHSEVVDVDPPTQIDWRVIKDIDANGHWQVEPRNSVPAAAPDDVTTACDVSLRIDFDPNSADGSALSLPRLVSIGWVVKKVIPLIRNEAERVVQRAVTDVEGRRRDVEFTVRSESEYL
jgi:uncharacterized membrane protein